MALSPVPPADKCCRGARRVGRSVRPGPAGRGSVPVAIRVAGLTMAALLLVSCGGGGVTDLPSITATADASLLPTGTRSPVRLETPTPTIPSPARSPVRPETSVPAPTFTMPTETVTPTATAIPTSAAASSVASPPASSCGGLGASALGLQHPRMRIQMGLDMCSSYA
jgi:hypothetical protein